MSHLFLLDAAGRWAAFPIDAANLALRAFLLPAVFGGSPSPPEGGLAMGLLSFRTGNAERWVVMAGPDAQLRVNGVPLDAIGLRVLADRDEISIPGAGSAYYSAEALPEIVPFPGADRVVLCGRCRQEIVRGSPSVKCPGCGTAYHETQDLNCFTYHEHCAFCPAATALDAGFNWAPEEA